MRGVVPTQYEIFDASKKLYLILELATGGDLFDRIVARGVYTEVDASRALRELCSALAHVHARGIIHRDLKVRKYPCSRTPT